VRELFRDGRVRLSAGSTVTVATLADVEPGAYLLFAKTTIVADTSEDAGSGTVRCSLNGDPAAGSPGDDTAETRYGRGDQSATLALHLTEAYADSDTVRLHCRRTGSGSGAVSARETKLIVVPVGSTTRVEVSGDEGGPDGGGDDDDEDDDDDD
jgi:hypothetical protein